MTLVRRLYLGIKLHITKVGVYLLLLLTCITLLDVLVLFIPFFCLLSSVTADSALLLNAYFCAFRGKKKHVLAVFGLCFVCLTIWLLTVRLCGSVTVLRLSIGCKFLLLPSVCNRSMNCD